MFWVCQSSLYNAHSYNIISVFQIFLNIIRLLTSTVEKQSFCAEPSRASDYAFQPLYRSNTQVHPLRLCDLLAGKKVTLEEKL